VYAADSSLYSLESGLSELIYGLSRSIVTVESSSRVESSVPGQPGNTAVRNLVSSGLIIDTSGGVLAAAESVVGQDKITVKFDQYSLPARIVSVDFHNMVALLSVDRPLGRPVQFAEHHACAGQLVIAMGNAFGLRVSPALGICAGARDNGDLQFSVNVTSGAVGGGVFDLSGRLLGLLIGAMGQDDQVAIAVPSYRLVSSVDYLRTQGNRFAGFMGIAMGEIQVSPPVELDRNYRLAAFSSSSFERIESGVIINSVMPGSPAAKAGIRKGDVIFAVGNRRVYSSSEMSNVIRACEPGMTINVELLRTDGQVSIPVMVGRRQPETFGRPTQLGLNLGPSRRGTADSLSQVLDLLRREIDRIEQRLNTIE
jgi:S1-C subfamily serine protease